MKAQRILFGMLMVAMVGCVPKRTHMSTDQNVVIIPAIYFQSHPGEVDDIERREFWTPTPDDVNRVEKTLASEFERRSRLASQPSGKTLEGAILLRRLASNLRTGRRQYVGILIGSKRIIRVNSLPAKPQKGRDPCTDWRHRYISVEDGGENFWHIDYDTGSDAYVNLVVNGDA